MLQGCFANVTRWSLALGLHIVFVACISICAQSPASSIHESDEPVHNEDPSGSTAKSSPKSDKVKRWLEIDALSLATRYRYIRSNAGITTANQQQYQVVARGRFKFDPKGKYSVYIGLFTGDTLTGGWNNTGWGTGHRITNIYPKQFYFNAKPAKWLEVQVGGIGPYNGENTEITGLDNDAYLMGERVQIRRPKDLYFDEISATNAYLGDVTRPSAFRRFKRLDESNYHQFMVRKQVNKRVGFSADYTFESGRDTFHEAINIKTPELKVVDRILFENYQRVDPDNGYGFNLFGEKKLHDRFTLSGGFARIDKPMFSADRFPPGKRFYLYSTIKLSREFSLNTALIQGVGTLPTAATPRTRLDIILTYNFLEMLHHLKIY